MAWGILMLIESIALKTLAQGEMEILRKELHDLKECQFRFLSTTPILTGFLLGLPQIFGKVEMRPSEPHSPLYLTSLLPLLVLLPAWWVFFDKAKTVTRIVGYYRVLEGVVRGELTPSHFPGWERSLEIFRRAKTEEILQEIVAVQGVLPSLSDREQHRLGSIATPGMRRDCEAALPFARAALLADGQRYWLLAYDTFAVLSLVSIAIPTFVLLDGYGHSLLHWRQWALVLASLAAVLWCCLENALILTDLMWGKFSYTANQLVWLSLLLEDAERSRAELDPAEQYCAHCLAKAEGAGA